MYHNAYRDVRSSAAYIYLVEQVALPLVRKIDPETAHNVGIWAAAYGFTPMDSDVDGEEPRSFLSTTVLGLQFRNPVGLAAGFDKGGEAMRGMLAAGFGFVEVGTITPKAQPGNPKPRMFRLPEDDAVINRYGFNSEGLEVVQGRVAQFWAMLAAKGVTPGSTGPRARPICGVNIGKNKEGEAIADYTVGMVEMAPLADYVTVNISSPNTPGLRSLQGREQLRELLSAVKVARDQLPWGIGLQKIQGGVQHILRAKFLMERRVPPPILVKIAPDLTEIDMADIAAVVMETGIDGIIVTNTTIARPSTLKADPAIVKETGGLSGQPLFEPSTAVLRRMYELTRGKVPLIGVGGIKTPEQAYTKIRNGASLVQLYTALAYEGSFARNPHTGDAAARHCKAEGS